MIFYSIKNIEDRKREIQDSLDDIPEKVKLLVDQFTTKVSSTNYKKTPIFYKNNKNTLDNSYYSKQNIKKQRRNKRKNPKPLNDSNWETLLTFEVNKVQRNEEGIQKVLNNFRINLNKITKDTYNIIKNDLLLCIDELKEHGMEDNDMIAIGENIFEIASSNHFFSREYAMLYLELIDSFDELKNVFDDVKSKYMNIFKNIRVVDPDEDYDEFCIVNIENEKRKALTSFITYFFILQKQYLKNTDIEFINLEEICNIIEEFVNKIVEHSTYENSTLICEEISTSFVSIMTIFIENKFMYDKLENHINIIKEFIKYKKSTHPSFTMKSKFEMMNVIDLHKKM